MTPEHDPNAEYDKWLRQTNREMARQISKEIFTDMTNISHLSSAELEAALKEAREREAREKSARRDEYIRQRDTIVAAMVGKANRLHAELAAFKKECQEQFEKLRMAAHEYGDIRTYSKGGFSLRTTAGDQLARLERNVVHEYDERADMALSLIKEFLEQTIKKRDAQTFRTISTLLERNKTGDLKPERVAALLKIKDNYSDERWIKAMTLLEESYREREVSYNVAFYSKDAHGKDQPILLTFSSL